MTWGVIGGLKGPPGSSGESNKGTAGLTRQQRNHKLEARVSAEVVSPGPASVSHK